jgi:hypothetical protein
MRSLFALSALLIVATTAPTMARDYPWCARTITDDAFGDCSFTSYQQCMATVSGQAGECTMNPGFSSGQQHQHPTGR